MTAGKRRGAIELFRNEHTREAVRERQARQGPAEIGAFEALVRQPVRAADEEREIAPVRLPGFQLCG